MRTTVDIESDLLERLRDEATRSGLSFRALLNSVVRTGLELRGRRSDPPFRMPTFAMGLPLVSNEQMIKANQLAGQLDDAETLRKMRLFESADDRR